MATRVIGLPTHRLFFRFDPYNALGILVPPEGHSGYRKKGNVQIPVKKVRYAVVGFGHFAQTIHVQTKNRWSQNLRRLFVKRRSEQWQRGAR